MSLQRPTFHAELSDGSVHHVEILHVDQLRAELEARKNGLPVSFDLAPVAITTLWVWASLVRGGVVTADYQEFSQQLLVQLKRSETQVADPVGPTPQGQPPELP